MAMQLPTFPPFSVHQEEQSAGQRWKKWLEKFDNMLCAMDITSDSRKKALLLHYVGEETFDIYDTFTDAQKGNGATTEVGGETVPNEYHTLKPPSLTTLHQKQTLLMKSSSSGRRPNRRANPLTHFIHVYEHCQPRVASMMQIGRFWHRSCMDARHLP